ncbi:MAG TPA: glycosyltransferase family 9 protein [Rudaea sp.]
MQFLFGTPESGATIAGPLPASGIYRVLICRRTLTLGNTLLLTPLIREIEATYPGAEIDIVGGHAVAAEVFGVRRSVQTIYRLPAHPFPHLGQLLRVLRQMRRVNYDLVIDPCPRSQTGRLLLLLARGRFKVGFCSAAKSGPITHPVPVPSNPRHAGQLPVALLRSALERRERLPYPTLDIFVSDAERQRGLETLKHITSCLPDATKKHGVIGVFANATGPKVFDADWWDAFLTVLQAHKKGFALVEIVPLTGRSLLRSRYPAYFSNSIGKLSSVLSGMSLFISADCGVMHLACASGVPTVGIFSVSDPLEWGPYGLHDRAIDARSLSPERTALEVLAWCGTVVARGDARQQLQRDAESIGV